MTTKNNQVVLFAALTIAMLAPFTLVESAFAEKEKVTDSLTIPNESRDLKLAAGYKLYPGVGWVSPADQVTVETIYREHPETGEKVIDLDAMIEKSKEPKKATITEIAFAWIQQLTNLFTIPLAEAGDNWNIVHKDSSSNDFTYTK